MSKQWYAAEWSHGEVILWCETEKGDAKPIESVLDNCGRAVITLTKGGTGFGGLFDEVDDSADMWKREELLRWATMQNRSNEKMVWTEAKGEVMDVIKRYHSNTCVVTALILQERTSQGEWKKTVETKMVLYRMRDWLNAKNKM